MKRLFLFLFVCYLLGTAIIFMTLALIYLRTGTTAFGMLIVLSDIATFYMALSVSNYRKRLINGAKRFRSLTAFQLFYAVLTLVVLLSGNSFRTDLIDRLVGLLFLSFFYAPVDIVARTHRFLKHRHSAPV